MSCQFSAAIKVFANNWERTTGSLLVGGGAVGGGDGDVVESEIDAELGAVVYDMIEEQGADGEVAGAVIDGVTFVGELPGLVHCAVGDFLEQGVGGGA